MDACIQRTARNVTRWRVVVTFAYAKTNANGLAYVTPHIGLHHSLTLGGCPIMCAMRCFGCRPPQGYDAHGEHPIADQTARER